MSSFGYSDSETCICCPCLTASQVLLFITVPFFGFNLYKLGLGVDYDSNCDSDFNVSQVNSRFGNNYLELAVGTDFFLEILTHIRNFMVNNTTIYVPLCGFLILGN